MLIKYNSLLRDFSNKIGNTLRLEGYGFSEYTDIENIMVTGKEVEFESIYDVPTRSLRFNIPAEVKTEIKAIYFTARLDMRTKTLSPAFVLYNETGNIELCAGNNLFTIEFPDKLDGFDFNIQNIESSLVNIDNVVREGFGGDPGRNMWLSDTTSPSTIITRDSFYRYLITNTSAGENRVNTYGENTNSYVYSVVKSFSLRAPGVKQLSDGRFVIYGLPTAQGEWYWESKSGSYDGNDFALYFKNPYLKIISLTGRVVYDEYLISNGVPIEKISENKETTLEELSEVKISLEDIPGQPSFYEDVDWPCKINNTNKTFSYYSTDTLCCGILKAGINVRGIVEVSEGVYQFEKSTHVLQSDNEIELYKKQLFDAWIAPTGYKGNNDVPGLIFPPYEPNNQLHFQLCVRFYGSKEDLVGTVNYDIIDGSYISVKSGIWFEYFEDSNLEAWDESISLKYGSSDIKLGANIPCPITEWIQDEEDPEVFYTPLPDFTFYYDEEKTKTINTSSLPAPLAEGSDGLWDFSPAHFKFYVNYFFAPEALKRVADVEEVNIVSSEECRPELYLSEKANHFESRITTITDSDNSTSLLFEEYDVGSKIYNATFYLKPGEDEWNDWLNNNNENREATYHDYNFLGEITIESDLNFTETGSADYVGCNLSMRNESQGRWGSWWPVYPKTKTAHKIVFPAPSQSDLIYIDWNDSAVMLSYQLSFNFSGFSNEKLDSLENIGIVKVNRLCNVQNLQEERPTESEFERESFVNTSKTYSIPMVKDPYWTVSYSTEYYHLSSTSLPSGPVFVLPGEVPEGVSDRVRILNIRHYLRSDELEDYQDPSVSDYFSLSYDRIYESFLGNDYELPFVLETLSKKTDESGRVYVETYLSYWLDKANTELNWYPYDYSTKTSTLSPVTIKQADTSDKAFQTFTFYVVQNHREDIVLSSVLMTATSTPAPLSSAIFNKDLTREFNLRFQSQYEIDGSSHVVDSSPSAYTDWRLDMTTVPSFSIVDSDTQEEVSSGSFSDKIYTLGCSSPSDVPLTNYIGSFTVDRVQNDEYLNSKEDWEKVVSTFNTKPTQVSIYRTTADSTIEVINASSLSRTFEFSDSLPLFLAYQKEDEDGDTEIPFCKIIVHYQPVTEEFDPSQNFSVYLDDDIGLIEYPDGCPVDIEDVPGCLQVYPKGDQMWQKKTDSEHKVYFEADLFIKTNVANNLEFFKPRDVLISGSYHNLVVICKDESGTEFENSYEFHAVQTFNELTLRADFSENGTDYYSSDSKHIVFTPDNTVYIKFFAGEYLEDYCYLEEDKTCSVKFKEDWFVVNGTVVSGTEVKDLVFNQSKVVQNPIRYEFKLIDELISGIELPSENNYFEVFRTPDIVRMYESQPLWIRTAYQDAQDGDRIKPLAIFYDIQESPIIEHTESITVSEVGLYSFYLKSGLPVNISIDVNWRGDFGLCYFPESSISSDIDVEKTRTSLENIKTKDYSNRFYIAIADLPFYANSEDIEIGHITITNTAGTVETIPIYLSAIKNPYVHLENKQQVVKIIEFGNDYQSKEALIYRSNYGQVFEAVGDSSSSTSDLSYVTTHQYLVLNGENKWEQKTLIRLTLETDYYLEHKGLPLLNLGYVENSGIDYSSGTQVNTSRLYLFDKPDYTDLFTISFDGVRKTNNSEFLIRQIGSHKVTIETDQPGIKSSARNGYAIFYSITPTFTTYDNYSGHTFYFTYNGSQCSNITPDMWVLDTRTGLYKVELTLVVSGGLVNNSAGPLVGRLDLKFGPAPNTLAGIDEIKGTWYEIFTQLHGYPSASEFSNLTGMDRYLKELLDGFSLYTYFLTVSPTSHTTLTYTHYINPNSIPGSSLFSNIHVTAESSWVKSDNPTITSSVIDPGGASSSALFNNADFAEEPNLYQTRIIFGNRLLTEGLVSSIQLNQSYAFGSNKRLFSGKYLLNDNGTVLINNELISVLRRDGYPGILLYRLYLNKKEEWSTAINGFVQGSSVNTMRLNCHTSRDLKLSIGVYEFKEDGTVIEEGGGIFYRDYLDIPIDSGIEAEIIEENSGSIFSNPRPNVILHFPPANTSQSTLISINVPESSPKSYLSSITADLTILQDPSEIVVNYDDELSCPYFDCSGINKDSGIFIRTTSQDFTLSGDLVKSSEIESIEEDRDSGTLLCKVNLQLIPNCSASPWDSTTSLINLVSIKDQNGSIVGQFRVYQDSFSLCVRSHSDDTIYDWEWNYFTKSYQLTPNGYITPGTSEEEAYTLPSITNVSDFDKTFSITEAEWNYYNLESKVWGVQSFSEEDIRTSGEFNFLSEELWDDSGNKMTASEYFNSISLLSSGISFRLSYKVLNSKIRDWFTFFYNFGLHFSIDDIDLTTPTYSIKYRKNSYIDQLIYISGDINIETRNGSVYSSIWGLSQGLLPSPSDAPNALICSSDAPDIDTSTISYFFDDNRLKYNLSYSDLGNIKFLPIASRTPGVTIDASTNSAIIYCGGASTTPSINIRHLTWYQDVYVSTTPDDPSSTTRIVRPGWKSTLVYRRGNGIRAYFDAVTKIFPEYNNVEGFENIEGVNISAGETIEFTTVWGDLTPGQPIPNSFEGNTVKPVLVYGDPDTIGISLTSYSEQSYLDCRVPGNSNPTWSITGNGAPGDVWVINLSTIRHSIELVGITLIITQQ